jgi:hypothetical protein
LDTTTTAAMAAHGAVVQAAQKQLYFQVGRGAVLSHHTACLRHQPKR